MSVDLNFTKALPKCELHAHLSGSVSASFLHEVWRQRKTQSHEQTLDDPLDIIRPNGKHHDVTSFFPLFDEYIYNLISDVDHVKLATARVIDDFEADGVVYLELRTTPRENAATGMSKAAYVEAVNEVVVAANARARQIKTQLILSVDRRMTADQADEVIALALKYRAAASSEGSVVAVDLCGNPTKGDVTTFSPAFAKARAGGLNITVHFAEVLESASAVELETILSWLPERLGHVIHVPAEFKETIRHRRIGLELCLSCNVLAGLTSGGFAMHHFGEWSESACPVALSTDDVGVFASPLSNEYFLAAQHFGLTRDDLLRLARSSIEASFSGKEHSTAHLNRFEELHQSISG